MAFRRYVGPSLWRRSLHAHSPSPSFRAFLIEVYHVSTAETRLGLPVKGNQNSAQQLSNRAV
jgi:hypothetical protein